MDVIAGLDRLDPAISMPVARQCHTNRDGRDKPDKPGHDDVRVNGMCSNDQLRPRAASSASSTSQVEQSASPSTRAGRKWRWNAVTTAAVASS
jgi:hypothetical protein